MLYHNFILLEIQFLKISYRKIKNIKKAESLRPSRDHFLYKPQGVLE